MKENTMFKILNDGKIHEFVFKIEKYEYSPDGVVILAQNIKSLEFKKLKEIDHCWIRTISKPDIPENTKVKVKALIRDYLYNGKHGKGYTLCNIEKIEVLT
jgi:hypothetical protein